MTRGELRDAIAKRIEDEFSYGKLNANKTARTPLSSYECDHIANLVFSVIGKAGLGIYQVEAIVVGEEP